MPQTKIQGKFYPLQHKEFLKLNKLLTQAELAVHLWLKTKDPFGDKLIEASTKQIADDLNVSRRTIQRALVKLRELNLIDLIITKFQYRVKSKPPQDIPDTPNTNDSSKNINEILNVATPGSPSDTSVAIGTRMSPSVRECRHRYENVAIGTGMSPPTAETQSEQKVENPKTLQTYSDFKRSLSEGERENFFNFVRRKTENLEKPINDLEAWLASKNAAKQNRWQIYYKLFQESKNKEKSRQSRQNGSRNRTYTLEQKRAAIARFQAERNCNRPDLNDNPREKPKNNSEEYRQQQAEFNQLLDNPPEQQEKSLAQQRREAIAKAKEQHEAIKRANEKAAEELTRQQNPDLEQRRLEMLRQIEEFNQRQKNQNPENNDEINEEDW